MLSWKPVVEKMVSEKKREVIMLMLAGDIYKQ